MFHDTALSRKKLIKGHGTQKNLSSKTYAISESANHSQEFKAIRKR